MKSKIFTLLALSCSVFCAQPNAVQSPNATQPNAAVQSPSTNAQPNAAYTPQNQAQNPQAPAQAPAQIPQNVAPQQGQVAPYPQAPMPQNYGLPPKIMQTINQMYPGVYIRDIDYEGYGYEVELGNRMDLFFDRNGNLLGQKYDY